MKSRILTYAVAVQAPIATSAPTCPAELNEAETQAWVGLLHAHSTLVKQLDAELLAAHGVSLSGFEVLWRLATASEGRLRMTDLAELVMLSPSGLSRLVDRLEAEKMIERVACPTDGRAINATITEAGRKKLEESRPTHSEGVRRSFLAHFDPAEIDQLAVFWTRFAPNCS